MTGGDSRTTGDSAVRIPVYTCEGGVHRIQIFEEQSDGSFRRCGDEPLRALRDNIVGLGAAVGELVSIQFDRTARIWRAPTVMARGERPQSVYEFLRTQVRRRRFYVFSKPSLSGRLVRFDVHPLTFKSSISSQVLSLFAKRYCEGIQLWLEHEAGVADDRHISAPQVRAGHG
jgi:hypothetical protein